MEESKVLHDSSQSAASPEGNDPIEAQGEARRVTRVLSLPWVSIGLSLGDGANAANDQCNFEAS